MADLFRNGFSSHLSIVLLATACGGRQESIEGLLIDEVPTSGGMTARATVVTYGGQGLGGAPATTLAASFGGTAVTTTVTATTPPPCDEFLIDDMEDGSGRIQRCRGRVGVWYAFNDTQYEVGLQWPELTEPGTPIETSEIPGGRGPSRRAIHTFGSNTNGLDWWAGIGFDLNFDGNTYGLYDGSAYDGLTFWLRGTSADPLELRIHTKSTTLPKYGGTFDGFDGAPFSTWIVPGEEWQQYFIPFAMWESAFFNPQELINVQFYCGVDCESFDFWVDDVAFYRD
jgi:hypothetical protein